MARPFGPEPDEFLQELARDLMQAIGKSLNQNEQVQRIVDRIETEGYQVALVLAALTRLVTRDGVQEGDPAAESEPVDASASVEPIGVEVDPALFDRDFLRRAGIKGDLPA